MEIPRPCECKTKAHKVKAAIKAVGNKMDEWSAVCPECGKKHKRELPNDAGYGGCDFECDCMLETSDTMQIINAEL